MALVEFIIYLLKIVLFHSNKYEKFPEANHDSPSVYTADRHDPLGTAAINLPLRPHKGTATPRREGPARM